MPLIGRPLRRKEDARLLRGGGRYAADWAVPGAWQATVVRSPHAHARMGPIDAAGLPRGAFLLTARELGDAPPIGVRTCRTPALDLHVQPLLPADEVGYVGQPVAVVVAPTRYAAEDVAERVHVAYSPLPARLDARSAPVADTLRLASGDCAAAFAQASTMVEERFRTGRHTAVPIETRGLVADWRGNRLTVYGETKTAYATRAQLAAFLGLPEERVRFLSGDVGGGFGVRGEPYPEDFLIPWLAVRLGRPVRWIEDRREHLQSINHSREMTCEAALALDGRGRFLALRAEVWYDGGAYARPHGMLLPEYTAALLPGPYRYEAFDLTAHLALTHKTPVGTFRGPGGYESCFVRERLVDLAARRLGLDPAEIRMRNLTPPEALPYDTGITAQGQRLVCEPGDYPGHLRQVLQAVGYETWRGQPGVGVGIACLMEKSADTLWEYARVELLPSGRATVYIGSSAVGQGIETVLAQICGDTLGVPFDSIDVVHGDTDRVPFGIGSFASRTTVLAGNAVRLAATEVRERAMNAAARLLEMRAEDLVLAEGAVAPRSAPARGVSLGALAHIDRPPAGAGLAAEAVYRGEACAVAFGCHAAVVRVDPETGRVTVLRYVMGHDVGRAVNPLTVRGQFAGGIAHGLGGTMLEELRYGADGQLLTASLADYLLPSSTDVPRMELQVWEDGSAGNPLGVKGAGESGVPGPPAALANAVAAALGEGPAARITRLPLTPESLLRGSG